MKISFSLNCARNKLHTKMSPPCSFLNKINRRKRYAPGADLLTTDMSRCLSTWDVTFFGLGHTVGAGLYVVIGIVAKYTAGPAVNLSYAFAAIAALFSALSYAELGT
ncbi:Cationic amino acid transporter 2 [Nymphon striatum]|nr:Cationic amino acid transporter 2 [Nymphon striatum]